MKSRKVSKESIIINIEQIISFWRCQNLGFFNNKKKIKKSLFTWSKEHPQAFLPSRSKWNNGSIDLELQHCEFENPEEMFKDIFEKSGGYWWVKLISTLFLKEFWSLTKSECLWLLLLFQQKKQIKEKDCLWCNFYF